MAWWNHDLFRQPVEEIPIFREVVADSYEAQILAYRIAGNWYPGMIPLYSYDEQTEALDQEVASMIGARFDPTTGFATANECLDAAEQRFRSAVERFNEIIRTSK